MHTYPFLPLLLLKAADQQMSIAGNYDGDSHTCSARRRVLPWANGCGVERLIDVCAEDGCCFVQGGVALPPAAEQAVEDAAASRNTDLQQRALELQALLRCSKLWHCSAAVDTVAP